APIHSSLRYLLLKWRRFRQDDPILNGADYFRILATEAERARPTLEKVAGRPIPPLLTIFNDGELFGHWSGEPRRDASWMIEFFQSLFAHRDRRLVGLADYLRDVGYVDTYPAKTSSSYVEFENWTRRRGIRGANFVDPKLRAQIQAAHHVESELERLERAIVEAWASDVPKPFRESALDSPGRMKVVRAILARV